MIMLRTEAKTNHESAVPAETISQSLIRFQNACLCASLYFDYEAHPALYTPRKKSHFYMSDTGEESKIEQYTSHTSLVTESDITEMLGSIDLDELEAAIAILLEQVSNKMKLNDSELKEIAREHSGIIQAIDTITQRLNKLRVEVGRLNALKREGHDVSKQFVHVLYLLHGVFKDNKNSSTLYSKYFTMVMGQ